MMSVWQRHPVKGDICKLENGKEIQKGSRYLCHSRESSEMSLLIILKDGDFIIQEDRYFIIHSFDRKRGISLYTKSSRVACPGGSFPPIVSFTKSSASPV